MLRRRHYDRAQLVLELERQDLQAAMERNPKGLMEALADLLLEALVAETQLGGADEPQDNV